MSIATRFIKDHLHDNIPKQWVGSANKDWSLLPNNQAKGKVGVEVVKYMLKLKGYEVRDISDNGDLEYRKIGTKNWKKCEVKTAITKFTKYGYNHWWNQIRPNQNWDSVALVGIYPNTVKVWWKDKKDFNWDDYEQGHTVGDKTDKSQVKIKLIKNSKFDNFHTWDQVYEG